MQLRERLEREGAWLFRLRGSLPLVLLPLLFLALQQSEVFEKLFGARVQQAWEFCCFGLSLLGVAVRFLTIGYAAPGTSGRNTRRQKADTLNTRGIYATVRHPLYLGNFLIFLGVLLLTAVWWFVFIGILIFWLYYERIMLAEESYLHDRFGQAYEAWADTTPIFFPRPGRWIPPTRPFDWKLVVRRESSTLFATVLVFTLINLAMDLVVESRLVGAPGWGALTAGTGFFYLAIRFLRKKTHLLD